MNKLTVFCDGGSRGNPGPAALGVFIQQLNKEYSQYLGITTNNEAEYQAIIFALKKIKQLMGKDEVKNIEIEIKADSELVVKQLMGQYKLKEGRLVPLFVEIWNSKQDFKKVFFYHIPREENKKADALVNRELDSQKRKENKLF